MDGEISPDGQYYYFVNAHFSPGSAVPDRSDIGIAEFDSTNTFNRIANNDAIMAAVNTARCLEYAPSISSDGLELFFTRLDLCAVTSEILVSTRASTDDPFGEPARIGAITGFVEAPSLSPDGNTLYYHMNDGGIYTIYRVYALMTARMLNLAAALVIAASACPATGAAGERSQDRHAGDPARVTLGVSLDYAWWDPVWGTVSQAGDMLIYALLNRGGPYIKLEELSRTYDVDPAPLFGISCDARFAKGWGLSASAGAGAYRDSSVMVASLTTNPFAPSEYIRYRVDTVNFGGSLFATYRPAEWAMLSFGPLYQGCVLRERNSSYLSSQTGKETIHNAGIKRGRLLRRAPRRQPFSQAVALVHLSLRHGDGQPGRQQQETFPRDGRRREHVARVLRREDPRHLCTWIQLPGAPLPRGDQRRLPEPVGQPVRPHRVDHVFVLNGAGAPPQTGGASPGMEPAGAWG